MYNGKHKSFKTVLYRAMKHQFCSDLSEEQAADYALELIRRSNLGFVFGEKPKYIAIRNYRGKIPNDLIYIRGARYYTGPNVKQHIYDTTPDFIDEDILRDLSVPFSEFHPIKYTGNIYQSSYHCNGKEVGDIDCNITYTINNNYIFLSEECGVIELSYRNLILDNEGYPMIPDNQSFEDALYYYILKEHLFGLLAVGKVSQGFYEKIEQEYSWAIGQASNNLKLAGMDHWEETMNGIRRLLQPQNASDYGYKELHNREKIRKTF